MVLVKDVEDHECVKEEDKTQNSLSISKATSYATIKVSVLLGENDANYVKFNDNEELLVIAHKEANMNAKDEAWFLDSQCSNHMIGTT